MLSPDGRCKTLDAAADGYVRSEACIVFLLGQELDHGVAHGGPVAVVRGSSVNQDGRSSSLTAPNGPAQQQVTRDALRDASLTPSQVAGTELHGTGTSLGDPIEIRAALEALQVRGTSGSASFCSVPPAQCLLVSASCSAEQLEQRNSSHAHLPCPMLPPLVGSRPGDLDCHQYSRLPSPSWAIPKQ
jgi:acyl transferase domain-containing protein